MFLSQNCDIILYEFYFRRIEFMGRFLIAFVHNRNSALELSQEIFKVSNDCSPYDVTVPINTVNFMFVTADVKQQKNL